MRMKNRIGKSMKRGLCLFLCLFLFGGSTLSVQAADPISYELSGLSQGLDLDWLIAYISCKESAWQQEQLAKMTAAGLSQGQIRFTRDETFQEIWDQLLCMTAVFRNYTFYNRVMCMWYVNNLWNEMHTYRIAGASFQENAEEAVYPVFSVLAGICPGLFPEPSRIKSYTRSQGPVTVVSGCRELSGMYAIDQFVSKIPVEWEGWTAEKQAECEYLLSLDKDTRREYMLRKQEESLADSPAPMYKQGAAEWADQPFGGGTMASDACGPTSIATVLTAITGERITPGEVAAKYDNDTYRSKDSGSFGAKMCAAAGSDYGIACEADARDLSAKEIRTALSYGGMIVMSMRSSGSGGRYATVPHYVALVGLTGDGRVIVNNPGINTDVTYDSLSVILDNQSGRGYGIFFPSRGAYLSYEREMHPEESE